MKLLSRNPDKPKKQLETTIGKIIYGFLLFAPLLSILVTCMYVTFNKNAYESYSGNERITNYEINYKYETNEVNTINDLIDGHIYQFEVNVSELPDSIFTNGDLQNLPYCNYIYKIGVINDEKAFVASDYTEMMVRYRKSTTQFYISNTQGVIIYSSTVTTLKYYFVYKSTNTTWNHGFFDYISSTDFNVIDSITEETTQASNLDNAFEYSTQKVENSNLYNWAKNTGTYDVVHNTTQLLGIENTFIPMLMAYWLLISVIYFIYDIALMLIMVVHRKIHELQESI